MQVIFGILFILLLFQTNCSLNIRRVTWCSSQHSYVQKSFRLSSQLPSQLDDISGAELLEPKPQPSRKSSTSTDVNGSEVDFSPEKCSKVVWSAAASATVRVKEDKRSCEDYMALPASDYSVLTAEQITRLSENQFKCVLGSLNFFGNRIQPVLYVDVNVYPQEAKSEIVVVRAETTGSDIAEKLNGAFSINAKNTVRAGKDQKNRKTLSSETTLQIEALVPKSRIPLRVMQSGGNLIIQSSLSVIVAAFVRILAADFARWSAGNDIRDAVDGASLQ